MQIYAIVICSNICYLNLHVCWILLLQASYVLAQYDYFVCPIEYSEVKEALHNECERAAVFKLAEYALPSTVQQLGALVCVTITNWLS